jgi:hypothetical protein
MTPGPKREYPLLATVLSGQQPINEATLRFLAELTLDMHGTIQIPGSIVEAARLVLNPATAPSATPQGAP